MVDEVKTSITSSISGPAGKAADALNVVDHLTSVPFGINRAITNGLFQIEGFAAVINSPLAYSLLMVPGMLLILLNVVLQAANKAKSQRSLHSRIIEILVGLAILGLCGAMFAGVAITLPLAVIGLAKGIYDFFTHLSSVITGSLDTKIKNNVTTAREYRVETANKVHNIVIAALTVTGAAFLFTPLAPIGAAILLAVTLYSLVMTISEVAGVNPFKWLVGKIHDAVVGNKNEKEAAPLLAPTPKKGLSSSAMILDKTIDSKKEANFTLENKEVKYTRKLAPTFKSKSAAVLENESEQQPARKHSM